MAEDVGTQRGEHALEDDDDEQADDEHVERGQPLVHEDLVHHDLEEQRADQREELQEQRDDQHFTEKLAVLDQAGDEPAEVELGEFSGQAGAAGDQDQVAGPLGGEDAQGLDDGAAALHGTGGVLEQHALAVALGEHDAAFGAGLVAQHGQGRQRRECQSVGSGSAELGLEADVLGREQQVGQAGPMAKGPAELMCQVGGVGGDLMQAGDQAEGREGIVCAAGGTFIANQLDACLLGLNGGRSRSISHAPSQELFSVRLTARDRAPSPFV